VEGASGSELRKAICRSFANVVKASPLADAIDPKAFVMMLSSNFAVLYRGGKLHLTPLWDALAPKHPIDLLVGLFLKLEEAARQLRVSSVLPPNIEAMDYEVRQLHLLRFQGIDPGQAMLDPSGLTPLIALDAIEYNANPEPLPLSTGDLKPLISDDLKRRVSQGVVQAVRSSPLGQRVQPAQVAYMVDTNFEQLCDGARFDFRPVYQALRELGDVTDADVYAVVLRLQDVFAPFEIELILPHLEVDAETAAAVAQRLRRSSSTVGSSDPRIPAYTTPPPGPIPGLNPQDHQTETRQEAKLRKFGFNSENTNWKLIRVAALVVLVLGLGTFAFLSRPNRELNTDGYNSVFPMQSAKLYEGSFLGWIDESRWYKLKYAEREKAFEDLTAMLRAEGRAGDVQIRDAKQTVVIASSGGRLVMSPVLRKNLPANDTTAPKEASAKKEKD
jgi:hypothetical protein